MILLTLLFSIIGLSLVTENHFLSWVMNIVHFGISGSVLLPLLYQYTFGKERKEKIILNYMLNHSYAMITYSISILGLNVASIANIINGSYNQSTIKSAYFINCLSGCSFSIVLIYVSILNKSLSKIVWLVYGMLLLFSTVMSGIILQFLQQHNPIISIYWSILLISFKRYLPRDIPFFLLKFLFAVIIFTQFLVLVFLSEFSKLSTYLYILLYLSILTWEILELKTIYHNFVDGKNFRKQGNLIIFQYHIIKTIQCCSSQRIEPLNCPICYQQLNQQLAVAQLPCSHLFHQQCLQNWFRVKDNCPVCRQTIELREVQLNL